MSSFDPLSGGFTTSDTRNKPEHPLAAPELQFHRDDEDNWTPPSLPGEEFINSGSSRFSGARTVGGRSANRNRSPLDSPLDPLQDSLPYAGSGTSVSARLRNDEGSFGSRGVTAAAMTTDHRNGNRVDRRGDFGRPTWGGEGAEVGSNDDYHRRRGTSSSGELARTGSARSSGGRGDTQFTAGGEAGGSESRTLSSVHMLRLHNYYAPTFCDACSQLLIGIIQQGLQCAVCRLNLHPECRYTSCSVDHKCRPPENVTISPGVDESLLANLRLRPDNALFKISGTGIFGGGNGAREPPRTGAPPEDPLNSEWHKHLLRDKQVWVPDSVAAACMVCSRPFNVVFRRHHCRRCGACMCGGCSHTAISDKVLSVNQMNGDVIKVSSGEPVRCCTTCTRILDYQLSQALKRKGWGARSVAAAAATGSERGTSRVRPSAIGGGYAASLPRYSDHTESFDGGGFAPPAVHNRDQGGDNNSRARVDLGSRGQAGDHRRVGDADPLARVDQRQPQLEYSRPPPHFDTPPQAEGVPAWLGKGSLGSRKPTGGNSTMRTGSDGNVLDKQESKRSPSPPEAFGDEDDATDWSNSRSVV